MKRSIMIIALVLGLLISTSAQAEFYFGGGTGQSFGGKISGLDAEQQGCAFVFIVCFKRTYDSEDFEIDGDTVTGGKVGYYFDALKGSPLGIELQYFVRNADVGRQPWSASGSETTQLLPTNPFSGQAEWDIEIKTFAILLMARMPHKVMAEKFHLPWLEPYAGIGVSFNKISMSPLRTYDLAGNLVGTSSGTGSSGSEPGFLATLGLSFDIYGPLKLFAEYKFSHFALNLTNFDTGTSGAVYDADSDLTEHFFMFGITFSFGLPDN